MATENINQEFRLENIEETINYFIKELYQSEFISNNHKNVSDTLHYMEHILILVFAVTGCISISALASLVNISMGITSSAIELKICAITVGIKEYKSIIKKKEQRSWLNSIVIKKY